MSQSTRLPRRSFYQDPCRPRQLRVEPLEDRRLLTASRAAEAINLFAYDAYEHMQNESGNLFFSPLSVASALTMAYAGAAGQTASEMANVLHVGTEPGIHTSYGELMALLNSQTDPLVGFQISVANAMWPQLGASINSGFANIVENEYGGDVQALDFYSNAEQAEDIINNWVEDRTHGKIEDLVDGLTPETYMVLTNTVYFKGLWQQPFDPLYTGSGLFNLREENEDEIDDYIFAPMMYTQANVYRTVIGGFQVLEMPFQGGDSSMVLIVPTGWSNQTLSSSVLADINEWFESSRYLSYTDDISLPKFEVTVATNFNNLLSGLGMPTAFSGGADFSEMTDAGVFIDKVFHKATLTVNEQGTEAAAATEIEFAVCFAAGTPVMTPEGEKRIEELQAGDYVLARDEHNLEGRVEPRMVERLFYGEANILELQVGGQTIRTTAPHRFFVRGRGWIPAEEIKVEDRLSTNHGDWIEVERVLHTNTSEAVYNLRVADDHTYFVGGSEWKFGVWVHNDYESFEANRPFHFLIRDNVTSTISFMGRINDPTQANNNVNPTVAEIPANGDFDEDGDVDGRDFLAWQRGNGDSNDLEVWQANYGQGSTPQLVAITDTALDDSDFSTGWLIDVDDAAEDDDALVIHRVTLLESVSNPVKANTLTVQGLLVDASIASRGRYGEISAQDADWLDDELLEDIFGAD